MNVRELTDVLAQLDGDAEVFVEAGYDAPIAVIEVRRQAGSDKYGMPYPVRVYLKPGNP